MSEKETCVIVGAGSGLGLGLATVFSKAGYRVVLARRNLQAAQEMAAGLLAAGHDVHARAVDAREPEAVRLLFEDIQASLGPIDVLVFNVGGNIRSSLFDTTPETFEALWRTNTFAGFIVAQAAAREMIKRGRGTILFSGATASVRGGNGFAAFAAAKNGLRAVAQSFARELAGQGIHVAHVVIDGGIDSPRMRQTQQQRVTDAGVDGLLLPQSIAQAYLNLHRQPRDAWTFEMDLRPWSERW